jgi:hypothetical protein
LTAKKKDRKPSAIGRIARAIDAAGRDADLARRSASDSASAAESNRTAA